MKALLLALVCAVALIWATSTTAVPRFQAAESGVVITLYDEPCGLPEVANLPFRAEWTEGKVTFQGCWTQSPFGVVAAYFTDKTVAVIPVQVFKPVQAA